MRLNFGALLLQLEAAKADAVKVQGDITYRNTRIDEVKLVAEVSIVKPPLVCSQYRLSSSAATHLNPVSPRHAAG